MSEKPRHCPGCGAALISVDAAVEILDEASGQRGWDCYCANCRWSGDVFPDDGGDAGGDPPRRPQGWGRPDAAAAEGGATSPRVRRA